MYFYLNTNYFIINPSIIIKYINLKHLFSHIDNNPNTILKFLFKNMLIFIVLQNIFRIY